MKERRLHKRYKRRFVARFGEGELSHPGFTHDISCGGAFIVSPWRPPLDSVLHLHIFVDKQRSAYFEATVQRHKFVPPELRSVDKGGFGLRFLLPDEVLVRVLVDSGNRLEVGYATPADLKLANEREIQHGGVFVPTERKLERGSDVILAMRLDFASTTFEFDASVVHIWGEGSYVAPGVGVLFKDSKEVEASLAPFLQ